MNIANAKLLICPFCKGEKPVIQLMSGNTCGATQRSDLKTDYPMLRQPSPVQRCPHCGKYYFSYSVESKDASFQSFDQGDLSYQEITEALKQFEQQPMELQDEINLRLLFIQTYNTTYQLEGKESSISPTHEEQSLFREQIRQLLEIWETEPLVRAEFLREAGRFDECLAVLDSMKVDEPFKLNIAHQIRKFAEQQSSVVFIVYGTRNDFV